MRTNDGRIDHLQRGVGHPASGERFQHHVPDAAVGPPPKLAKDRVPVAEFLRQVAPRRARSHHPKHGVEHAAMVPCRPPAMMDQERFETRPLIIAHQSANQDRSPQRAALNQLAIPSSMGLSTRPNADNALTMIGRACRRRVVSAARAASARLRPRWPTLIYRSAAPTAAEGPR